MTIKPNIEALKSLACFSINSQHLLRERLGEKVFDYKGDITSEFQNMREELLKILLECKHDLDKLIEQIPVNSN